MTSSRLSWKFTVTLFMVVVLLLSSALGVNQALADDPVWLTVSGKWEYADREENWVPAQIFNVRLYNYTTSEFLAWDYTDSNGDFEFDPVVNPGSDDIKIRMYTRAKHQPNHYYTTATRADGTGWDGTYIWYFPVELDGTETDLDVGTIHVPSASPYLDACWIKDALQDGFERIDGQTEWKGGITTGEPVELSATVRAIETGDWVVTAKAGFPVRKDSYYGGTRTLYVSVSEKGATVSTKRPASTGIKYLEPATPPSKDTP